MIECTEKNLHQCIAQAQDPNQNARLQFFLKCTLPQSSSLVSELIKKTRQRIRESPTDSLDRAIFHSLVVFPTYPFKFLEEKSVIRFHDDTKSSSWVSKFWSRSWNQSGSWLIHSRLKLNACVCSRIRDATKGEPLGTFPDSIDNDSPPR